MKVSMLSPSRGNSFFQEELEEAALRVLRSGKFILGEEVEKFEEACQKKLEVKHAIGVSSGTDALILSLMALGIGPGDEVICPSFTFFATAGSISRVGATPVFVDILPETFNIDILRAAAGPKTKAIIPVHLFGQSCNMDDVLTFARKNNLFVIEDSAQAIGATWRGNFVGGLSDAGCFSFFPSKNLGGFGDAGLVTTNSDALAEKLKALRVHGGFKQYEHLLIGGNFRIDALQAAMLNVKLKHLPSFEEKRRQHASIYFEKLRKSFYILPFTDHRATHTFNQFTIQLPDFIDRKDLMKFLAEAGVSSAVYYPIPLHKQVCYSSSNNLVLPVTEKICEKCLSLPIASELIDEEIEFVCEKLLSFKS